MISMCVCVCVCLCVCVYSSLGHDMRMQQQYIIFLAYFRVHVGECMRVRLVPSVIKCRLGS